MRSFSRLSRVSRLASTSASGATPVSSGEESVKQVGQRRLHSAVMSASRMQVCWVCISGSPRRYAAGTGSKLPRTSGMCCLVGAVHCSR